MKMILSLVVGVALSSWAQEDAFGSFSNESAVRAQFSVLETTVSQDDPVSSELSPDVEALVAVLEAGKASSVFREDVLSLATVCARAGDVETFRLFIPFCDEAARCDATFNLALMAGGDLSVEREDYFAALQFYRAMKSGEELLPEEPGAGRYGLDRMLRLAACYDAMGRRWASYMIYERVNEQFSESPDAAASRYAAFECLVSLGESASALEMGRALCEQAAPCPRVDEVKYLMGTLLFRAQDYEAALALFHEVAETWPDRLYAEDASYWGGMCLLFTSHYDEAITVFDGYLTHSAWEPKRFESDVTYRLGVAQAGLRDYEAADSIFKDFLVRFPESDLCSEAHSMLGDSAGAVGELEPALEAYALARACAVNVEQDSYAVFQMAQILELLERSEDLVALVTGYLLEWGTAGEYVEASLWVSKSLRAMGEDGSALEVECATFERLGNDPHAKGLERVSEALIAQANDSSHGLAVADTIRSRLGPVRENALADGEQKALALQLTALFSQMSDGEEREAYVDLLLGQSSLGAFGPFPLMVYVEEASVRGTSELIQGAVDYFMSQFAASDLMLQMVNVQVAAWIDLKDYDRAVAVAQDALVRYPFHRAAGVTQKLAADALRLSERYEEAIPMYEHLLEVRAWRGPLTPQAHYWIGFCTFEKGDPVRAFAYFQRVYVLYAQYTEWAAKAYAGSVRCLQQLGRQDDVIRTWLEMESIPEIAKTPEGLRACAELTVLREANQ